MTRIMYVRNSLNIAFALIACTAWSCGSDSPAADSGPPAVDATPDAFVQPCPDPDPNAPDEDNDGIADHCDNCPSVANPDQEDAGDMGDGVGDVCDPRPSEGGDSVLFIGFNASEDIGIGTGLLEATGVFNETTGVMYESGGWSISDGRLHSQQTMRNPALLYLDLTALRTPVAMSDLHRVLIDTTVTVNEQPPNNNLSPRPGLGVVTAFSSAAVMSQDFDLGYLCMLEKRSAPGGSSATTLQIISLNRTTAGSSLDTFSLDASNTYRFSQYYYQANEQTSNHICQATLQVDGADAMALNEQLSPQETATGTVGLYAQRTDVSFDYLTIYLLGGPVPPCNEGAESCF